MLSCSKSDADVLSEKHHSVLVAISSYPQDCMQARFRPQEHRRGAGLDDSDASSSGAEDGGGPDGLPGAGQRKSKKKKKTGGRTQADFSEEDTVRLGQLFEQYGNQKGYVDTIQQELGGKFPRSQVQRQLKALGLKKGQLTANQVKGVPC